MKQLIKNFIIALGLLLGMGVFFAAQAGAINVFKPCSSAPSDSAVCASKAETINTPIQNVIGTLIFAVGVISVIMIIIGGIRYVLSNGDASNIKSAKDTILYAVIGLIVALLAYTIVNFVTGRF